MKELCWVLTAECLYAHYRGTWGSALDALSSHHFHTLVNNAMRIGRLPIKVETASKLV